MKIKDQTIDEIKVTLKKDDDLLSNHVDSIVNEIQLMADAQKNNIERDTKRFIWEIEYKYSKTENGNDIFEILKLDCKLNPEYAKKH